MTIKQKEFLAKLKKELEEETGMSWEEYSKLDTKERYATIGTKEKIKKFKEDVMDCVPIARITLKEKMKDMEEKMLIKPKRLVKKITNKVSNK